MSQPPPTAQDRRNAALRAGIAQAFQRERDECRALAEQLFGPGWTPLYRHYLADKDDEERCRKTGERLTAAATVYTVADAAGGKRHFLLRDGQPVEVAGYEEGFGAMLFEPHPTRRFEHQGRQIAGHRYSLCFAPYHDYRPKSADQLAGDRWRREERAVGRLAEANPLFAEEIQARRAQPEPGRRGRPS